MNASLFALPHRSRVVALAALLALPVAAMAQTPLYEYDFDAGSGTTVVPSVGAGGTGTLTMVNNAGTATSFYSADGAGVSGLTGDYAFNNSATVYNNGFYAGGFARSSDATATNTLALGTLSAFTLTMWINPTTDLASVSGFSVFPRLAMIGTAGMDAPNATSLYFALRTDNTGNVGYDFGAGGAGAATQRVNAATTTALSGTGWKFVAVTFDVATDSFSLFVGNQTTAVSSATDSGTYNATAANISFGATASAYLLNRNSGARAFDGMADHFAIYSGVLSTTDLNNVRLAAVPEPSTYAALAGLAVLGFVAARRRRA